MAFTYISGRGREGAALSGAEGACCEHDGFCEGGLEERNWVFVVMDWKERKVAREKSKGELLGNRHGPHYDFASSGLTW